MLTQNGNEPLQRSKYSTMDNNWASKSIFQWLDNSISCLDLLLSLLMLYLMMLFDLYFFNFLFLLLNYLLFHFYLLFTWLFFSLFRFFTRFFLFSLSPFLLSLFNLLRREMNLFLFLLLMGWLLFTFLFLFFMFLLLFDSFGSVLKVKPNGQLEIKLDSSTLMLSSKYVKQLYINFWPVEGTITRIYVILFPEFFQS